MENDTWLCLLRKRKKSENVCLQLLAETKTRGKCFLVINCAEYHDISSLERPRGWLEV